MAAESGQVVCFETFRRARQRRTARVLPYLAPIEPSLEPGSSASCTAFESPFRSMELTDREVAHRERMLRHLSSDSANGSA